MTRPRRKAIALLLSVFALVFWLANTGMTFGQKQDTPLTTPKERAAFSKPDKTTLNDKVQPDVIVIKFREGTHIRARSGQFIADLGNLSLSEENLLQRNNLDHSKVVQELNLVNNLFQTNSKFHFERLFTRPENELDFEKQQGELNTNEELADLNLYYYLLIENAQPEETEQLIDQLNAMDIVEIAYPQPIPEPAQVGDPAVTPDFTGSQGYLNAAPQGIDARYAWNFSGGRGQSTRMIDVETGWNFNHEDLPPTFYRSGVIDNNGQHGTAVLGEIAARENGIGITGIAPQTAIGASSANRQMCVLFICWTVYDVADAINRAATQLSAGDAILIEQHARGPSSGQTCTCNCGQFEFIAMEYWQDIFDAIRNATAARGITIVEAAGNGSMDLDHSRYGGRFNRSVRDSGAIVVGAGTANGRSPECWTNYGSRVDVQGWGDSVMTLGYGDIRIDGTNQNRWYTTSFSGTSSASPIVTGAAADVNGIRKARGLPVLDSFQMRTLLRNTGTAQASSTRQIGPLPNLRAVIDSHGLGACTSIVPSQSFLFASGYVAPNGYRDYCFSAVQGQTFDLQTCAPGSGNFDTIIDVRDASGSTILASNDDACGFLSSLSWQAPTNGSYRVRVRGFGASSGNYTLAYRFRPPACNTIVPAPNFQFANGSIASGGFQDYCFNASAGQRLDFQTCAPGSANFDTIIDVLNTAGTAVLISNDDACGVQSQVSAWPVPSSGSYRVRMRGFGSSSGNFSMAYRITPGTLAGIVRRAADSTPISGALVQAFQGGSLRGSATTNAGGSYAIGNLPVGAYNVTVSAAGFTPQTNSGLVVNSAATTTANFSLVATPGAIAGQVRRASDNAPMSGVLVQASPGGSSATTDAGGNYLIGSLPPGTYSLTVSAAGFVTQTRSGIVVNPGATATANFALAATPGAIAGQVTKASDSTPISGAVVQASGGGSATTDASGNYLIGSVPPGTYSVTVNATAYATQTLGAVVVNPGATAAANFALTPLPVSFAPATSLAVGTTPSSIAGADFNADAKLDLAVANYGANTVSVLLGAGDGTFSPATNYAVDAGPQSVNWDDVNGDAKLDLLAANRDGNNVSILLGNGDGTFGSAVNYSVGTLPVSVSSSDFNGDAFPDVVTANRDANTISLLLNNGDGTFGSATDFGTGSAPNSVFIADFDSDGNNDLAIANRDSGTVSILLGNGAGSFSPGSTLTAGSAPVFIIADDLNGDSITDLVVANSGSNDVSVFLGNGDGTFNGTGNFAAGTSPYAVAIGDFNSDGKADLAVANFGSNTVSILLGNGDGTFALAGTFTVGTQPIALLGADLNGDGKMDLAVVNSGSNTVSILLNNTITP